MSRTAVPRRALTSENVTREYLQAAAPGQGTVVYEAGYKTGGHQAEIQMANWMHRMFGGDIILLAESTQRRVKMPDYLWRGKFWELKSARSINGVDKSLQHAIKQIQDNPGGVILNVLADLDMAILERQAVGRFLRGDVRVLDIMILSNGELLKILRHKK